MKQINILTSTAFFIHVAILSRTHKRREIATQNSRFHVFRFQRARSFLFTHRLTSTLCFQFKASSLHFDGVGKKGERKIARRARTEKIINKLIFFTLTNNFIYRERFHCFSSSRDKKEEIFERCLRRSLTSENEFSYTNFSLFYFYNRYSLLFHAEAKFFLTVIASKESETSQ